MGDAFRLELNWSPASFFLLYVPKFYLPVKYEHSPILATFMGGK
jgi:hypothetical protein